MREEITKQMQDNMERIERLNLELLYEGTPWQGMTKEETRSFVEGTLSILKTCLEKDFIKYLEVIHINALNNVLNQIWTQTNSFQNLKPQQISNQTHNALAQINSLNTQLRSYGLFTIEKLDPTIIEKREIIEGTLEKATKAEKVFSQLKEQIEALIDPSTSTSLSKSFDTRKKEVFWRAWLWFAVLIGSLGFSVWFSFEFVQILEKNAQGINTAVWVLRILILLTLYFVTGFAISQYNRERNFEEIYAHKQAVAQTLPSYSHLITNNEVKDQITSQTTQIVFSLPFEKHQNRNSIVSDIEKLSNIASKFVSK